MLYHRSTAVGGGAPTAPVRQPEDSYLPPLMSRAQQVQHWSWVTLLLATLAYFWIWWLRPEHNISTFSYVLNSIGIAWQTFIPIYFVFILPRARVPSPWLPLPPGYRVAMVVTKVPSEPFAVVRETLH